MTPKFTRRVQKGHITLMLTLKDAKALRAVGYRVGGQPEGPRGGLDRINIALHNAGVPIPSTDRGVYKLVVRGEGVNGGLYFP